MQRNMPAMTSIVADSYDAIAPTYDSIYATPHELTENRFLSMLLRKWRFFDLPEPAQVVVTQPPEPHLAASTGLPDRRFAKKVPYVPNYQWLDVGCGTGLT